MAAKKKPKRARSFRLSEYRKEMDRSNKKFSTFLGWLADKHCPLTEWEKIRRLVTCIANSLEGWECAGVVILGVHDPGRESAEYAVARYRRVKLMLDDAAKRLDSFPSSEQAQQVKIALTVVRQVLSWPDCLVPKAAEMDEPRLVIDCIRESFHSAWEQVGQRLRWLAAELAVCANPDADGQPGDGADDKKPLTIRARVIYERLSSLKEGEAMTLPRIQAWYETQAELPTEAPKTLDEGTWKRVRQELLPYGLSNRRNVGYYIKK